MDTNNKPKLEEAGAFWIKKSKTGNSFLTGAVKTKSGEEIKVIVFKNKYKTEGSNQPDYRVYFDNGPANKTVSSTEQAVTKPVSSKNEIKDEKVSVASEEIPF